MKVAALILGPAGIGLVGIFHNLIQLVATLASFGIGNVSTRQIAASIDDPEDHSRVRRAMAIAAAVLGFLACAILFIAREPVARLVLDNPGWSKEVGWLSIGAALLTLSIAQNGLLTGLHRLGDLARVSVFSALAGTAAGIAILLAWREQGLLAFVLVSPLVTTLVGLWFIRRAPRPVERDWRLSDLVPEWKVLLRLGLAFTLAAMVTTGSQLAVRSVVQHGLGTEALGYAQAAWTISLNYIGFVLTGMAIDYFPRLSMAMKDPAEARKVVGHQVEVVLLLAGPVLVGTVALAPWLLSIMFSPRFAPAIELLRWQILGDFLKLPVWAIGFVMLAGGLGRTFVVTEAMNGAILVGATYLLLPYLGLAAPGAGYLLGYAVYLPVVMLIARRTIGYRPSREVVIDASAVVAALTLALLVSTASPIAGRWPVAGLPPFLVSAPFSGLTFR